MKKNKKIKFIEQKINEDTFKKISKLIEKKYNEHAETIEEYLRCKKIRDAQYCGISGDRIDINVTKLFKCVDTILQLSGHSLQFGEMVRILEKETDYAYNFIKTHEKEWCILQLSEKWTNTENTEIDYREAIDYLNIWGVPRDTDVFTDEEMEFLCTVLEYKKI